MNMYRDKIGVFLVDDHAVLREGLKLLINAQPDMNVVGESDGGGEISGVVTAAHADLVVMDVSMPGLSGAQTAAKLKAERPEIVIVALTRHSEKAYLQLMLVSGASGYVLKQAPASELINAIRTTARGGIYLDPQVAGKLIPVRSPKRSRSSGAARQLTEREQEVATMIALGHSNKETALTLGISVKTVETHKAKVMEKLEITSRAELVRFAIVQGWLDTSTKN
jgi:DNA-binding NarL/FixJ family response regulator